ncbi:iron-containing alcohol dehydrogenase [Frankia sp. AiPs1]|uniref:iron-containing alcohol dehydrogenase n=1 Tax=Frankia sp. AiPs1 TaxID=573493 RepID=UPI002043B3F8|nr:iron-containing alcohol dehydrogenase [Frankia sp. AiPs1]MCM3920597.1 iron-containing alcohol dehydrogenase [Frankia sp. AiPs1]
MLLDLTGTGAPAFLAPRQVLTGAGSAATAGAALRSWGVAPGQVLVVADRVVSEAGLLATVVGGLADAGFEVTVFDDVAGEPTDTVVARAADAARAHAVTAVVGVGGGSALDLAKAVALLATNPGSIADWVGVVEPPVAVAPLLLVPTTTGTGSEATRISMITIGGVKRIVSCAQFVPLVAVLDADLVADLPAAVVASTGMDAIAHGVESMLSTTRTALTLAVATEAVRILTVSLEPAALDGDRAARGRVLYASHLAGLALNAGVVLGHSLAYVIARHAPMPHGTSCALALPYCLAYDRDVPEALAAHIARAVTADEHTGLRAAAERVDDLARRLGLPRSLDAVGIRADLLAQMAAETIRDFPRPTNPVPMATAPVHRLLTTMHRGSVADAWELDLTPDPNPDHDLNSDGVAA